MKTFAFACLLAASAVGVSLGAEAETEVGAEFLSFGLGGAGSSLDVTTIRLKNFKLSAGKGGEATGYEKGGGGGGVKVDDTGPERPNNLAGEGYGAGSYYGSSRGLPGAVLLDFASEE